MTNNHSTAIVQRLWNYCNVPHKQTTEWLVNQTEDSEHGPEFDKLEQTIYNRSTLSAKNSTWHNQPNP